MPIDFGTTQVAQIPCDVYTPSTRTSGTLNSLHTRFSDALNAADTDFLLLRNVDTCNLGTLEALKATAATALIRRDSVLMAVPRELPGARELGPQQQAMYVHKRPVESLIEAHPFVIRGVLHLPPAVELLQHAHEPLRAYMPVTEAKVTHINNPALSFTAPFLLLSRKYVEVMIELAQLGQTDTTEDDETDTVRALDLSAQEAGRALTGTPIFEKADSAGLQEACAQMVAGGGITRLRVPTGAELFSQGDMGRTLYLVESGRLGVFRSNTLSRQAPQHVATLGAGEYAGEMALMGDGKRTATLRAEEDAVVLAVDAASMKALMHQFPCAASALLRLMLDREGGLDASRRSLPTEGNPRLTLRTPFRLSEQVA